MPAPKDPVKRDLWIKRMSEARTGEKNPNYGKPVSDDRKKKQSKAMKGKLAGEKNPMFGVHLSGEQNPFYGKQHSEESKEKIRNKKLGHTSWNKGVSSTWTKGIPRTETTREKISKGNTGKPKSDEHKEKLRIVKLETTPTGENSVHWKGGITKLNLHIRTLPRYKKACSDLMNEVDYTDHFTGKRGGVLACHHIIPQNLLIKIYNIKTIDDARRCDLLFDKHNLIVMLSSAHAKFHDLYGDDKNIYELTQEQLAELYQ